jgi:long-chain acyl-CoA synthetase
VQLQSALEQQFAVELDEDAVAGANTVGDLRSLLDSDDKSYPLYVARSERHETDNVERTTNTAAAALQQPASAAAGPRTDENIYPHWPWSWPIRLARIVFLELIMRPLVWLLAAPKVKYVGAPFATASSSRVGSNATPHLIIANHITAYDGALVLYALPGHLRRHVASAMSGEMLLDMRRMRNQPSRWLNPLAPIGYWLITALFNVFPLPRIRGFRRSFAHAGQAMDNGYSVLIFPEGTRSRTGHMGPFRSGIGLLAQESQVPILPVALVGIYDYIGPNATKRHWFHAGNIEVRVGTPIPPPSRDAGPAEVAAQLEQALRSLLKPGAPS